jgi:hypothetical protein
MKKALAFLLLLALNGMSVFSEVTLGGVISGGLRFVQESDTDPMTYSNIIEDGDSPPPPDNEGIALNLMINGNFEKFGASVMMEYKGLGETVPGAIPNVIWGYGWVTPFGEILKIDFGRLDNAFGQVQGMLSNVNNDETGKQGIRVLVSPISGLSVGIDLVEMLDYGFPVSSNVPVRTTENFFKSTLFGAKYTSDLFNVFVTYKLSPLADFEAASLKYGLTVPISKFTVLVEGSNVKGPEGVGYNYEQYQKITYQITDPLNVSLRVGEKGDDIGKFDKGSIALRLDAGYVINSSLTVSGRVDVAGRQNGFEDPDTQIRARLDWNIAPPVKLTFYDNYMIVTKDGEKNVNTIAIGLSCAFF